MYYIIGGIGGGNRLEKNHAVERRINILQQLRMRGAMFKCFKYPTLV